MLKMYFSFIFLIFLKKDLTLLMMFISLMMIFILLKLTLFETMIFDNYFLMDNISTTLTMLTLMSFLLISLSSDNLKKIITSMLSIILILLLTFSSINMISFYILFELVLIPTMILIMMSGKQPERLQASIYLLVYTILASLPLLMIIILSPFDKSFILPYLLLNKINLITPLILAFLVKSPMFMTHLWLPKAHVEAPLEGSMILAAILLKLGGYGLMRFLPFCLTKMNLLNSLIFGISMVGVTATGLNCIRQKDLKSLIAYSSVAHMALVLLGLFSFSSIGLTGALLMMIAHGLSSSALFLLVNDIYYKYHSRNIMSFKGMLSIFPNMVFWWFLFMAINVSAPPSINTISEILIMMSMILWEKSTMIMIFFMSMSVTIFSMMMFLNLSHNKNKNSPSISSPHKTLLSLFTHFIPLIILITKMEIFLN